MKLDWVSLKEEVTVDWSGATYTIDKGTVGRVLKDNSDGTVNVSFGFKGTHPLAITILEPQS